MCFFMPRIGLSTFIKCVLWAFLTIIQTFVKNQVFRLKIVEGIDYPVTAVNLKEIKRRRDV